MESIGTDATAIELDLADDRSDGVTRGIRATAPPLATIAAHMPAAMILCS